MFDALVIGSGPAGLAIAAALCEAGLSVQGLTPISPDAEWPNTYGIWCDELEALGLTDLLAHRWTDSTAYFGPEEMALNREYGLFDKRKLQTHLLEQCDRNSLSWHQDFAASLEHTADHSRITTQGGQELKARIVIDASGHKPVFIRRSQSVPVAFQAAYGIVGRFSSPPVRPGQFVLMDYRSDHLSKEERREPPTFLYAMDMGDDIYFVEETSLSHNPAVSFKVLEQRLHQRLAYRGVHLKETHHVEHCLFPMNLPLPDFDQPIVGFGGAAGMVHPASGYMVGALLRRAPGLADAIAQALNSSNPSPNQTAQAAWQALWSQEKVRKHYLYLFGLEKLMRFDEQQLTSFFTTFFSLPQSEWSGFLADTHPTPELLRAMLHLFGIAPNKVRLGLMRTAGREGRLFWQAVTA
ncbi:MAG: lycopene cyclase family protein [Cyanobacteria bacterium Co-bin8]|nr:lycopene cyclase family protein [Cyanobacteria bacterium Co-bin8]